MITPVPSKQYDEIENLDERNDYNENEPENSDNKDKINKNMEDLFVNFF